MKISAADDENQLSLSWPVMDAFKHETVKKYPFYFSKTILKVVLFG
jgi:hypothetical protein